MSMKMFLILPFAIAALAGCAASEGTSRQAPQANTACSNLSGAAYLECQKSVEPASRSTSKPFKMVKPKGNTGGFGGIGS
jgi:hypothetical protein